MLIGVFGNMTKHKIKTRFCDICGLPMIKGVNCSTRKAKRCCLIGTNKLSPCQIKKNIIFCKGTRKKYYKKSDREKDSLPDLDRSQEAMRECLRCDSDENGIIPQFLSLSPSNRICEACSNKQEAFKASRISAQDIENSDADFMNPCEAVWMPERDYHNSKL